MKATPARAGLYCAAVWLLCIAAMVASGGIVLSLAQQSEASRREREYCDDVARDEQGYLPSSCCTDNTLVDGYCVEAAVRDSSLCCVHPRGCYLQSPARSGGNDMVQHACSLKASTII